MDNKQRMQMQLECLYDMFRDRIEEDVIYFVYTENEGRIDTTIDQLMSISSCSFTGHQFEPKPLQTQAPYNATKPFDSAMSSRSLPNGLNHNQTTDHTRKIGSTVNGGSRRSSIESKHSEGSQARQGTETKDADDKTIDERIENLQKSIENLLLERNTSNDKASQYLTKKMYPVTSYYSELASQLRRMVDLKTNELVELLLQKSENSTLIDLHGLNPVQARLVVSELLNIRKHKLLVDNQGEASIDIITGWGKHRVTSGHRIRPTIVAFLREQRIEYHHLNKGALRVTIRR